MKHLIQIENRVGKVRLNDAVNPWSTEDLIGDIERLYGQKAVVENMTVGGFTAAAGDALETLELEIHSPGGSVLDGYRIYHSLRSMQDRGVKVVATVNTLAASMASVIIMAADEVRIMEGGRIMIHEASQTVTGDSASHARSAKILEEMSDEIAEIYAARTGSDKETMRALMKAETWMGAKEAVAKGFAHSIVKSTSVDTNTKAEINTMGLFTKNEPAAALIALESENAEIRNEFSALQSQAAESAERVVALRSEVSALTDDLASASASFAALTAELTIANEAVAGFDDKVEAAAQARFESIGGSPIASSNADEEETKVSRVAFNGMTPAARSAFCLAGGKIS